MSVDTEQRRDGLDSAAPISGTHALHAIYAFFYNKRVGVLLILAAGLLSMVGILFRQMPDGVADDPSARQAWVESVRPIYGGWTGALDFMGFFHIFTSLPFLIVMGMLALSIIACTTHRLPVLRKTAFDPHVHVKDSFYTRARYQGEVPTTLAPAEAMDVVRARFKKRRARILDDERSEGLAIYTDVNHLMPFGTVLAHAAFVLIMVGFVVSSTFGFRNNTFTLIVDQPREVGYNTGLTAEAKSFHASYYEDGTPEDYVTDLAIYENGAEVARKEVRVNYPLTYKGVIFYQSYFGIAGVVRVVNPQGEEVFAQGIPLEWRSDDKQFSYGSEVLPDGHEVFVATPASGLPSAGGIKAGQVRVEFYETDGETMPLGAEILDPGESFTAEGYTLTFEREQQFTGLMVKKDPGTIIVWIACAMLTIGTCMTMVLRHRRIWVRVVPTETGSLIQFASHDRMDPSMKSIFNDVTRQLTADVRERQ